MALHPFFDALVFPWSRPEAGPLLLALSQRIKQPAVIELRYEQCGGTDPLNLGQRPQLIWKEALDRLTGDALRKLCEAILRDKIPPALEKALRDVCDAEAVIAKPVLPNGRLFLDRKNLRAELEAMSQPDDSRVLLVRGNSTGRTWTLELIKALAADRGVGCVYLDKDAVRNARDAAAELFAALGDSSLVPPVTETDDAWYKRVCREAQELALKNRRFLWVVADDLGEYDEPGETAKVPRINPDVRAFFHQFVLRMVNPAFAQWFRLVLIDYPDGPVPTQWKAHAWVEDCPDESEVDGAVISEFLLAWARHKNKNLGPEEAAALAEGILARVAQPPTNDELARLQDPRRLARINAHLGAMIKTL